MEVYRIRLEPLDAAGPDVGAIIVAEDEPHAIGIIRNDGRFSGYRLPPAEMVPLAATRVEVRQALGATATHEAGVYRFALLGPADPNDPNTPPVAI